jgi:hypothetical protein
MVDPTLSMSKSGTMSTSPLVDLVQAIHLPSHRFLLTTSANTVSASIVDLYLFAPTPASDNHEHEDDRQDTGSGSGSGSSSDSSGSNTAQKGRSRSIITWHGQIDIDGSEVCLHPRYDGL